MILYRHNHEIYFRFQVSDYKYYHDTIYAVLLVHLPKCTHTLVKAREALNIHTCTCNYLIIIIYIIILVYAHFHI